MTVEVAVPEISGGTLSVKLHQSQSELEDVRSFWLGNQHHPNSDFDHFLLVCGLRSEVVSPCVFSLWQDGSCRSIVAGRIILVPVQPQIGYLKLPSVRCRMFSLVYEGVIGGLDPRGAVLVMERIKRLLADRVVDMVTCGGIKEDSALFSPLQAMGGAGGRNVKRNWAVHWELTLNSEPGFLVAAMKSKHRSWIRRKERDLEMACPGKIVWRWHHSGDDAAALCRKMEAVAALTYQRGLGAGFKDDHEHQERLALFARQGALRIMLLEIDGRPAAFWLGLIYRGTFYSESTGYLPELHTHEAGTQMFLRLVDELVKEGVRRFDFGLGDAHYKQRFGDRSWRETSMRSFAGTARGRMLKMYLGTCGALDQAMRAVVQKAGVADKLKQAWRRRLKSPRDVIKPKDGDPAEQ